jgi:hypothetical protein
MWTALPCQAAQPVLDPQKCVLSTASSGDKTEAVPSAVERTLKRAAARALGAFRPVDRRYLLQDRTCRDFFGEIHKFPAPKNRQLYVGGISLATTSSTFELILYDPTTKKASQSSARLNAKWTDENWSFGGIDADLNVEQSISWTDLYRDANPVLVFRNIGHNGTMYQATIYHYFHVGRNLNLTPVLARETDLNDAYDDSFAREIVPMGGGMWKMITTQRKSENEQVDIGYVLLKSLSPGQPFSIAEFHPVRDDDEDMLVTGSGEKPASAIIHGQIFEY